MLIDKKHSWQQKVVRIYDPTYHIVEIVESMEVITKRYLSQGLSVKIVSDIIKHPIEFAENSLK